VYLRYDWFYSKLTEPTEVLSVVHHNNEITYLNYINPDKESFSLVRIYTTADLLGVLVELEVRQHEQMHIFELCV